MPDTIVIRKLDPATYDRFRRGAAARGITQAEYLTRLLRLQESAPAATLADTGLEPVTA